METVSNFMVTITAKDAQQKLKDSYIRSLQSNFISTYQ